MSTSDGDEKTIRDALEAHDTRRAVEATMRAYGPEIHGFLASRLSSRADADEVFARFAEDVLRGLEHATIRTTVRAYAYACARNAARRYLQREVAPARAAVPLSAALELDALVARPRTPTPVYARTDTRDRFESLRAMLSDDERALLVLRVDRRLAFKEIAVALGDGDDLEREAARFRKRFEALKTKLRALAANQGLLVPR